MEESTSSKRRRTSPSPVTSPNINDIPNALLPDVAAFLPTPSRALFALAMTAPTLSWRKSEWKRHASVAGGFILSSTKWESLDLGSIETMLAGKLTDDDVCGILSCINAKETLQTLKLTGCINITGTGLEHLRGSLVLRQVDVSLVGHHECPYIDPDPQLSEATVLPILDSIIDAHDNSLKHVQLPYAWRNKQSRALGQLLEKFNQLMAARRLCCSTCNMVINDVYEEDHTWYDDRNNYGMQLHTCCNCMKNFCDHHEGRVDDTIFCSTCERSYCTSCVPEYDTCHGCGDCICKACGELEGCNSCQESFCRRCMHDCTFCNEAQCRGCKQLLECEGDDCDKEHCAECFDGRIRDVVQCDDCDKEFCNKCRRLSCIKDWPDACVGCERVMFGSGSQVLTRQSFKSLREERKRLRDEYWSRQG